MDMRFGIGTDIHRLMAEKNISLIKLGGIDISCSFSIQAHSDGDVLLHALTDALLGSLALGDIGEWFPEQNPDYKNRESSYFVETVLKKIKSMNYKVYQLDSVITLETPKLRPHFIPKIRENLSKLLSLDLDSISVKVKTNEKLDALGEGKAIAATVLVAVKKVQ